jgi:hypothetical protein
MRLPIRDRMGCETWKNFSAPPTMNDKVPALAPITPEQAVLDLLGIQEHPHELRTTRYRGIYHLSSCIYHT